MTIRFAIPILCVAFATLAHAQRPWQRLESPTAATLAAQFRDPPPEYSATVTWGWDSMVDTAIARDLDILRNRGFRAVTIEAGYRMTSDYLSDGWFALVNRAVVEARKRDMRIWIIDEGKYPSGFAGGKFSRERPDLRMQGVLLSEKIRVRTGETVRRQLDDGVVSAVALALGDSASVVIALHGGRLEWTAPAGDWEVWLARHDFKTSVTRAVNNASGGKDTVNSLFDYLNPAATRQFIEFTHEQYRRRLGDEFGRTILGFRGDEPDYGHIPWTPAIVDDFERRKGYDVRPYLASFLLRRPNAEARRAKADYWDVWSAMFGENFFRPQADWMTQHQLEHTTHLNHEDKALLLARSEGDYFRAMRHVQIPGVDVIWNQVWPDSAAADFPKLASSAAHLFGRPRALSESFAAFNPRPTIDQAKWVIDHQLARGINLFEFMFYASSARGGAPAGGYMADPRFPELNRYTHRMSYVLSRGRPTAAIALLYPTSSLWLGDGAADSSNLKIARQLLEHQRDFDWVDETSLAELLVQRGSTLVNLSGQGYGTVIVPSVTALSTAALDKLRAFGRAGGRVVFLGRSPSMVTGQSFLHAEGAPDLSWAVLESSGVLNAQTLAALPSPDVQLHEASADLRYQHRRAGEVDVYFLFNEGRSAIATTVSLRGKGAARTWDAFTGNTTGIVGTTSTDGYVRLPVNLAPGETRLIVLQ